MKLQKKVFFFGAILSIVAAFTAWALTPVSVEQLEKTTLTGDPLQYIDSSPTAPAGTLLYIASVSVENQRIRQRHLVLHEAGNVAASKQRAVYHIIIPESVPEVVFDPQFVSDGKTVIFKAGWPYDDPGYYRFYFWDFAKKQLQAGPSERSSYRRLFVSPKGDFVAYYVGGNSEGNEGSLTPPVKLFAYSRATGKSVQIVQNAAAKYVAWTTHDKLLYSVIDESKWIADNQHSGDQVNPLKPKEHPYVAARPDVFETSSSGGTPTLLLKDGYQPTPSPNDQWIAFFTSTDDAKKISPSNAFHTDLPRQSYLCLYNRITKQRTLIQPVREYFPQLTWTSDSRQLIIMKQTTFGTQGEAQISILNVSERAPKQVATLKAVDFGDASRGLMDPQFKIVDVSKNATKVFVKVSEFTGQGQVFIDEKNSLQSIDIQTGKVSLVAQVLNNQANSLGMDWYSGAFPSDIVIKEK